MKPRRKPGRLTVVVGRTQSGKTRSVCADTKRSRRLLVWDIEGVWAERRGITKVTSRLDLLNRVTCAGAGSARLAFVSADRADFEFWADCAYWWGRAGAGCNRTTDVVAEEIAFVTSAGKAPPGWHRLLAQGLKWGINIYAITQRPAESDKTCLGNATELRCFDLSRAEDRRYMARQLDCSPELLTDLMVGRYVVRDMLTRRLDVRALRD